MNKQAFSALALAALALAGFGCKKSETPTSSGVVATVNGQPISMDEYNEYLQHMRQVQVQGPQGRPMPAAVVGSIGFQALQDLIQNQLILSLAQKEGVTPTDQAIDTELANEEKDHPGLVKEMQAAGYTLSQIRDQLKLQLARENIITKGVTVTVADAKDFIKKNPKDFTNPAQADLLYVVVKDAATKAKVDSALSSGQPFRDVAMKFSIANDAKTSGGRFPVSAESQMPQALQKLVDATPVLKMTDWKHNNGSQWVKFYVESKTPAKPMPVNDALISKVQQNLKLQKGATTQSQDFRKSMIDELKDAKVDVSIPDLQTNWDQVQKQIKAQPAGP